MKLENPFRVTVKFSNGDLRDYYTLYAKDLDQAKEISKTKYKESEEAYGFIIHEVKPLIFNPRLK
jgi:hypothetical protein